MLPITQRTLAALTTITAKDWHKLSLKPHLFEADETAAKIFYFMNDFVRQHAKVPSLETIREQFHIVLPAETVEPEFLNTKLQESYVKRRLAQVTKDLQDVVKTDPMRALQVLGEECQGLIGSMSGSNVVDFKQAIFTAWPWMIEKWTHQKLAVPLYYPTLQRMMGGVYGGEVISTIGRPGLGKTWTLICQAMHTWSVLKQPVVFVSMEIMVRKLMERMIALYTLTPSDWFKHGDAVTMFGENKRAKVKNALIALEQSDMPPFHLVDGNLTASAEDVAALCSATRPSACFVDGAYMLKSASGRSMKGFEKIEEICATLKRDVATNLDIPLFASWQFNRDATKVSKGSAPALEHIAGGDHIGFISSLVLGLVDDSETMDGNTQFISRRKLHVLKGRDGERGVIQLNWDFAKMDFGEVIEMQYDADSNEWLLAA